MDIGANHTDIDQQLDARGLSCPLPLLKTRQALRHLATGRMLEVVATDAASARDIPAYVGQSPHELVRHSEARTGNGDREYRFLIRRGAEEEH